MKIIIFNYWILILLSAIIVFVLSPFSSPSSHLEYYCIHLPFEMLQNFQCHHSKNISNVKKNAWYAFMASPIVLWVCYDMFDRVYVCNVNIGHLHLAVMLTSHRRWATQTITHTFYLWLRFRVSNIENTFLLQSARRVFEVGLTRRGAWVSMSICIAYLCCWVKFNSVFFIMHRNGNYVRDRCNMKWSKTLQM